MDDDIRNRFKGVPGDRPVPRPFARPVLPQRPAPRPAPVAPAAQQWTPAPASPAPVAPAPKPVAKPAKQRRQRGRLSKKLLFMSVGLILLVLLAAVGYGAYKHPSKKPVAQTQTPIATNPAATKSKLTGTVRLIATGDNLSFDTVNASAKKADGSYDYLPMMSGFKTFFDKSDIRICNESTPGGGDKNGLAISGYPNFNAATEWSTGFAGLGCNVINLASDHINDKGQPAIDATLTTWDAQKSVLAIAGANRSAQEQAKIRYFTVKGLKFAYLAYTSSVANKSVSAFGVNQYSDATANAQIIEAHKNADLVLVSMNWGTENNSDITADQDRIAQNLADQNVDVVIGGGPHVVQPAKILTGKKGHQSLVWFSLGNFLNSELPIENLIGGMAVMDFDAGTQQIQNPKFLPVYMHYEWTAAQKAAGTVAARHDLKLYPLDLAADALGRSQNNTNVAAQTSRVSGIITKFAPIKVIKSAEF